MLSYAFGILSEYIRFDLSDKLAEHLGLEKAKLSNKRKSATDGETKSSKRMKTEVHDLNSSFSNTSVTDTPKEKKVSAKEKQLLKAASNTKSIASFFTKK